MSDVSSLNHFIPLVYVASSISQTRLLSLRNFLIPLYTVLSQIYIPIWVNMCTVTHMMDLYNLPPAVSPVPVCTVSLDWRVAGNPSITGHRRSVTRPAPRGRRVAVTNGQPTQRRGCPAGCTPPLPPRTHPGAPPADPRRPIGIDGLAALVVRPLPPLTLTFPDLPLSSLEVSNSGGFLQTAHSESMLKFLRS